MITLHDESHKFKMPFSLEDSLPTGFEESTCYAVEVQMKEARRQGLESYLGQKPQVLAQQPAEHIKTALRVGLPRLLSLSLPIPCLGVCVFRFASRLIPMVSESSESRSSPWILQRERQKQEQTNKQDNQEGKR